MRKGLLILALLLSLCPGLRAVEGYVIVDGLTGYVLASKDRDDKRQIASLTKIATAMVVLDWAKLNSAELGEKVAIPAGVMGVGGVNPTGFQPGDRVSLRDLLYAALMASDNIAAHTLAFHVGRRLPNAKGLAPEKNFMAHMNGLAKKLEMKRTRFMNPSGLDSMDGGLPYSTAEDLARLTRYAYQKPSFQFYVSQKTRDIQLNRGGQLLSVTLRNTNPLLDRDGVDGVKTGRTAKAGDCIILSGDRVSESSQEGDQLTVIPRRVIVVLLGVNDRSQEGAAMMRKAWQLHDQWVAGGRLITKPDTL
jgi:D-alanyl-D-alanine carboxypeptidase